MKTTLSACCAVVAAGAITIGAQSPAPQSPQQPTQSPQTRPQPDRPQPDRSRMGEMANAGAMTVTGCLKTWDASMKDSSGTADPNAATGSSKGPASATPRYVLTDVTPDGMQKDSAPPSAQSSQQSPYGPSSKASGAQAQTLALMADGGQVDFSKHLNHKVQLTGKLDAKDQSSRGAPQASSTGTSGSTGTATAGRSAQAMPMTVPTFTVSALKMISSSCS